MKKIKISDIALKILESPNIVSRKPVFEKYDKNVQANTVLERGMAEAGVTTPLQHFAELPEDKQKIGVATAIAGNPLYGKLSAFSQGENAVAEATMKIFAVGAEPLSYTDCLNFGNPEKKEQMGDFASGVDGVSEAGKKLDVPIISGNVSFYNESDTSAIPPSVSIFCVGKIEDSSKAIKNFIAEKDKKRKFKVFILGERRDELGGSIFYNLLQKKGKNVPKADFSKIKKWGNSLVQCAQKELIYSSKVISIGGLFSAIADVSIRSNLGITVSLEKVPDHNLKKFQKLFSETFGFLLFVEDEKVKDMKDIFNKNKIDILEIAHTGGSKIKFLDEGSEVIKFDINKIKKTYQEKLLNLF